MQESRPPAAGLQTLDGVVWSTNARCCCGSLSPCLAGEGNTVLTPGKVDTSWGWEEGKSLSNVPCRDDLYSPLPQSQDFEKVYPLRIILPYSNKLSILVCTFFFSKWT